MKARIHHSRKGTFIGNVTEADDTWIDVEILNGEAHHISESVENSVVGDVVRLRRSLCIIEPLR